MREFSDEQKKKIATVVNLLAVTVCHYCAAAMAGEDCHVGYYGEPGYLHRDFTTRGGTDVEGGPCAAGNLWEFMRANLLNQAVYDGERLNERDNTA